MNFSYSIDYYVYFSKIFNEHETPAGNSVLKSRSKIEGDVVVKSIKRL